METFKNSLEDNSWEVAYDVVRSSLRIPAKLPNLMRMAWLGIVEQPEFMHLLASPDLCTRCLLRAAHIPQLNEQIQAPELQAAVDILGVKASALVLAINCICERTLDSGPPNRVWSPLLKNMMSEIEIGYHFGSSLERVGYEQGMLVGFSRLAGLAVLLIRFPQAFAKWFGDGTEQGSSLEAVEAFGCEPYQVSALLMQQLGLGPEVALATASSVGDMRLELIERNPFLQTWSATYDWVHALKSGLDAPTSEVSRATFQELCFEPGAERIPEHLTMLHQQVEDLRKAPSLWTWHLPLPTYEETAKASVHRISTNTTGTTWTKGLLIPEPQNAESA